MTIPIYIINAQPLLLNNSLVIDLYYLCSDNTDIHCIRIYNIYVSFLVARLPGLTLSQFKKYITTFTRTADRVEYRNDLSDAAYFNFDNNRDYAEIFATNPQTLKTIYDKMHRAFLTYYARINPEKLTTEDKLFYRNTETPFRFTDTTTKLSSTAYFLATKYNIPLIGGAEIYTKYLDKKYSTEYLPRIDLNNISGLNASYEKWNYDTVNERIRQCIIRNESIDFKQNMTLLAYDIETYNPTGVLDPTVPEYYVFSIGVGIFNLIDKFPKKRFGLLSKKFNQDEVFKQSRDEADKNKPLNSKTCMYDGTYKALIVYDEYDTGCQIHMDSNDDNNLNDNDDSKNESSNINPKNELSEYDYTKYIFAKNEKELLEIYIKLLEEYHPQVITGFNTFGFDDNYMYERMKRHGLTKEYLQCFTYYDISSGDNEEMIFSEGSKTNSWFKPFMPVFRSFELKIDNEPYRENKTVRSWLVANVDVYKLMLKEDAKRFTQQGYGNLDTMLATYNVRNPFNNESLSKTGLKIHEMYRRWIEEDNLYSIALYCCQDAWITGTLLISRSKLADLIEMSGISNTLFNDSIYKADGVRVQNSILGYAYKEKFALMDTPFDGRQDAMENEDVLTMGGKEFDQRVIVGGQVRNIHAGKQEFVTAGDFSSMYPANKEASNIDSSSRVDEDIINHPEDYGLSIVQTVKINDMYGEREIYYIKKNDY